MFLWSIFCCLQADCTLCGGEYVLGASMDSMARHLCMPKHLTKWLEHADDPPSLEDLKASLPSKLVPFQQGEGHESYVQKRKQTKVGQQKKAEKLLRTQVQQNVRNAFTGTPVRPPAEPTAED